MRERPYKGCSILHNLMRLHIAFNQLIPTILLITGRDLITASSLSIGWLIIIVPGLSPVACFLTNKFRITSDCQLVNN